jgi:excisionase family DNA binding protein
VGSSTSIETGAPTGRFCTIREAAEYLGVGETFVKERIRSGELASVNLGAGRRVVVASLVEFADAREREARRPRD